MRPPRMCRKCLATAEPGTTLCAAHRDARKRTIKACNLKPVEWRPVNLKPYDQFYEVSNTGQVRRIGKQTPLRSAPNSRGYWCVILSLHGVVTSARVSRLVALTFLPNPDNKPYVNHKDGYKPNNHVLNLEWCSRTENNAHSQQTGLRYKGRPGWRTGARSPVCKAKRTNVPRYRGRQ